MFSQINWAIEEDQKYRFKGVKEGIYELEKVDLSPSRDIAACSYPIVARANPPPDRVLRTTKEFIRAFYDICPHLEGFDLKRYGLVIAGSAAYDALVPDVLPKDVDAFMVRDTDDECIESINALLAFLAERYPKSFVYRTRTCITISIGGGNGRDGILIQLVLRRYSTLAEIIHGFDIGASSIAFDGENVWLTALSIVAVKYALNILNMKYRRPTYEKRLVKYFQMRGIGIVMPDLRVPAYSFRYLNLPYLSLVNGKVIDTLILVTRIGIPMGRYGDVKIPPADDMNDADDMNLIYDGGIDYRNSPSMGLKNLRSPCILGGRLEPGFDFMKMSIVMNIKNVTMRILHSYCNPERIKPAKLKYYFGEETAKKLMMFSMDGIKERSDVVAQAIEDRIRGFDVPFKIMGVEDGTCLTGPFPREVIPEKEWYGKYFRE